MVLFVGSHSIDGIVVAQDSNGYIKKATWHETLLASREALVNRERAKPSRRPIRTFSSEIIRGGEPAKFISVPISGAKELFLYVTGAPEVIYGAATWADAKLVGHDGKETLVYHAKSIIESPGVQNGQRRIEVLQGRHDVDRNLKAGVSGPLRIAGRQFEHGIHVYAPSKVRIRLDKSHQRFEARIGIDDWVGNHGAVRFHVVGLEGAARLDLWRRLAIDFPEEAPRRQMKWEREDRIWAADWEPGDYTELARRYAAVCFRVPPLAARAAARSSQVDDPISLEEVRQLYYRSRGIDEAFSRARRLNLDGLRLAIEDLIQTFGERYPHGPRFLAQLSSLRDSLAKALEDAERGALGAVQKQIVQEQIVGGDSVGDRLHPGFLSPSETPPTSRGAKLFLDSASADLEQVVSLVARFGKLQRESLLANPLMDFDRLLLIRRVPHGDPRRPHGRGYGVGEYIGLPRQSSKCNPNIEHPFEWDNEIAILSPVCPEGHFKTLYKSEGRRLITDVDLHWDADRLLFSMPGSHDKWHVFEINVDGTGLRQLTPTNQPDVHFYDSCYVPNGDVAFVSTAPLQGVPCNAAIIVGMMYMMDGDGNGIRQVCFEQDHTYCPTVLNDGRLLYLRWDYTDTPHVWNRILFSMNPDGTGQAEYYGSNSYWPNAIFYARPIPDHPTKVVGIVTGHHVGRVGELVIFDPAKGRHEVEGVVQRIPGHGQNVEPLIEDKLTEHSWPKAVHPYPLSEKHVIVSCKPTPDSLWGVYLVDIYDNMVLIKEQEHHVLVEPIPLRKTKRPPVIINRVKPGRNDALVNIADIYAGQGLRGVPRGTVKKLRVFTYHFGYQKLAGIHHRIGADGPWEVKRVLGTVPVERDGSALFRIPAKTPISIQPLDEQGKAVQLMRSWMTAMPGEVLSCTGCHEKRNSSPPSMNTIAGTQRPSRIAPWYGPVRGFSFEREVQPVLEKYCVGCHDGSVGDDGLAIPDLRGEQGRYLAYRHGDPELKTLEDTAIDQLMGRYKGIFPPSYIALRRLVRVGGLESDLHVLSPNEFHADTSELVQMLQKGHHNVQLDSEAWDRLITWIDLNAPCHGTWSEFTRISGDQRRRRSDLRQLYGGVVEDGEEIPQLDAAPAQPIMPAPAPKAEIQLVKCETWPFDGNEARRRQAASGLPAHTLDLGGGVTMGLARVPAGSFVMGDVEGDRDESPPAVVIIEKPFWMGRLEVTNRQFAQFDPSHDSRFEHRSSWIFSEDYLGWPLDGPDQPVVRVSRHQAKAFCRWLSEKTGLAVTLPTEAQWEYACRAGTDSPVWYGDLETNFAPYANMADEAIRNLAYQGWRPKPPDLVPRDARFNDGHLVTANVGSYRPNPWGLFDMHGNVWEWTRTEYLEYPYRENDGRNEADSGGRTVVRGGSWYDRPKRCRSGFRLSYKAYQRVFNVGFRVVCEEKD